ncbi:Pleckstrin-like, plant [Dillenia turbinata]|uniref:Pleckstrin-like, plant n=1 Tax=Dillenia turbinata TaxID=194707 RepID=A0AAN8W990_9MAGN
MDFELVATPSEAHPETLDFLSSAWCNFAIQALQPELEERSSILHHDHSIKKISNNAYKPPLPKTDKTIGVDDSLPSWKSNDLKSWIWMQQAMHPELNYNGCFRKKWFSWKNMPFKNVSIKKWLNEIKQKRKEEDRLQRAEVHAAVSVAGLAAALAAIAAGNSKGLNSSTTKESAVATAAALVAAQCAQVAEAMGAKREQLSTAIGSAMRGISASDILTLTAAATTSLRGAATLKARTGCRNRLNGTAPILPIEENGDVEFDFDKFRSILAKGAELNIETSDGKRIVRSVSVVLRSDAKVILKLRNLRMLSPFAGKTESVVLDLHVELYKESEEEEEDDDEAEITCYLIVLTTNCGVVKLDMIDDYSLYQMWAKTISQMLKLSTSFTKYENQFHRN